MIRLDIKIDIRRDGVTMRDDYHITHGCLYNCNKEYPQQRNYFKKLCKDFGKNYSVPTRSSELITITRLSVK